MFPSYTNQVVDSQSESTDWFLYDRNIGREKVKRYSFFVIKKKREKCRQALYEILFYPKYKCAAGALTPYFQINSSSFCFPLFFK